VWSRILAGLGETWVIVGLDRRPGWKEWVEERLAALPVNERSHHVYVDLPVRVHRVLAAVGIDRASLVSYLLWQFVALRATRRLMRERTFDIVWHLTYANAWVGSLAAFAGLPFVFGPVGGGVGPPWRLAPALGARGIFFELQRSLLRTLARHLNLLARLSWRRARLILVQNPETRDWLPARDRQKSIVLPNAVVEKVPELDRPTRQTPRVALFAARLEPWKGGALALGAISRLADWDLLVCGTGSDETRLRRLCLRLGLSARVHFRGQVPRSELLRLMRGEADVLLFPSMHDEGSWVVAEAVANGLPVICLNRGGPPVLGGRAVRASTPSATVRALAEAMQSTPHEPPPGGQRDLAAVRDHLVGALRRVNLWPSSRQEGTLIEARTNRGGQADRWPFS
jgi:glycosyltransferase involved in cell wall biosynthesis